MEQLHKIFKLCGSPSEEYWKKSKLPHATIFKPQQSYKRCIAETFKDFPPSSLPLIETLLAIDPAERQTATAALRSEVSLCSIIHYYIFSSAASSSTIFYRDVYELGHLIENVLLWLHSLWDTLQYIIYLQFTISQDCLWSLHYYLNFAILTWFDAIKENEQRILDVQFWPFLYLIECFCFAMVGLG